MRDAALNRLPWNATIFTPCNRATLPTAARPEVEDALRSLYVSVPFEIDKLWEARLRGRTRVLEQSARAIVGLGSGLMADVTRETIEVVRGDR